MFILFLTSIPFHAKSNNNTPSPCGEGRGGVFFLEKSRECFAHEDYDSALFYINKAELSKGKIQLDPALAAAIHEQYCLIFSALDDKLQSDYHRNMYLDIQEHARQDYRLDKHADELHKRMRWLMLKSVLLAIAVIAFFIAFFYFRKLFTKDKEGNKILKKKEYQEKNEELQEQIAVLSHQLLTEKKQGAEKRAKLSLLQAVSPQIARLRHALKHTPPHPSPQGEGAIKISSAIQENNNSPENELLKQKGNNISPSPCGEGWGGEYILDLLTEIERHNALLTDWIRMEQGKLSLKIETFSLSELQDILQKNAHSFVLQGITLNVNLPDIKVKADKVLTLFMLNTLADNARKATPQGGVITINATFATEPQSTEIQPPVLDGSVIELSVEDTGCGMTEEETANIFSHSITNGHGFGLLNCRGIINSYKKAGRIFNCCMIGAESTLGKGSRFFFRLPIAKLALLLCTLHTVLCTTTARPTRYTEQIADPLLRQAADYADSAYYSNLDGNYEQTLLYADSVQLCLMQTYSDSLLIDDITVDICNEAAVAALALHRWEDYHTYNNTYENTWKRLTNDNELLVYCQEKERFLNNFESTWQAINIITILAFATLILGLLLRRYHKYRMLKYRNMIDIEGKQAEIRKLTYETEALHIANNILTNGLSTIKHETMYYPSRIKALIDTCAIDNSQLNETEQAVINRQCLELVTFYEELYNNLLNQITSQKLSTGIHIQKITTPDGKTISADPQLYEYLLYLIKKYKGKPIDPNDCFTPKADNIPLLIARQIVRDMSASSTSRGNGIIVNDNNITLKFGDVNISC